MFFSLSLGMGAMITYGSYLDKKEDIQKNSWIIPACDTTVAVMAAMAVLPGCAAFGLDYGSGPGLLFNTMQNVFVSMGTFGNLFGFLFYFLVFIAAITSSISLYEVIVTNRLDAAREKGKKSNRAKIICIAAVITTLVGLPVALDAIRRLVLRRTRHHPRSVSDTRLRVRCRGRADVHRRLARLL